MRKDVKTGMFIGIGLVFVGWVLFALFSDSLQDRRQKQMANELPVSAPAGQLTTTKSAGNPPQQKQPVTETPKPVPAPVQAVEKIHVVEAGQTLSSISTLYYGKGDQWNRIIEANSDVLKNPSQLRPGMRLKIPAK
jgi:nucleoid-associated protein YgaU